MIFFFQVEDDAFLPHAAVRIGALGFKRALLGLATLWLRASWRILSRAYRLRCRKWLRLRHRSALQAQAGLRWRGLRGASPYPEAPASQALSSSGWCSMPEAASAFASASATGRARASRWRFYDSFMVFFLAAQPAPEGCACGKGQASLLSLPAGAGARAKGNASAFASANPVQYCPLANKSGATAWNRRTGRRRGRTASAGGFSYGAMVGVVVALTAAAAIMNAYEPPRRAWSVGRRRRAARRPVGTRSH